MFEKYPSTSPYAYCMNNPVNVIDPTGKDGIVAVDEENKTVTIKMNIVFYAAHADISRDELKESVSKYKENIMNNWSKDANGNAWTTEHNGETYTVNFDINFSIDQNAKDNKNFNGINNYVGIISTGEFDVNQGVVYGSNNGYWEATSVSNNAGAHEFGHFLGLKDRYSYQTLTAHSGWEENVMSNNSNTRVEQRNIDGIFNSVRQNANNTKGYKLPGGSVFMFNLNTKNRER